MAQAAMSVEQGAPSQADAFGDGAPGDLPIPGFDDFSGRHAMGKFIEDLPHHDTGAFERRLAVADQWIGDDVLAEFEAFHFAVHSCLHIAAVELRLAERYLQERRKAPGGEPKVASRFSARSLVRKNIPSSGRMSWPFTLFRLSSIVLS